MQGHVTKAGSDVDFVTFSIYNMHSERRNIEMQQNEVVHLVIYLTTGRDMSAKQPLPWGIWPTPSTTSSILFIVPTRVRTPNGNSIGSSVFVGYCCYRGGSVAEWLTSWTQAQKSPGSNRSRVTVLGKLFTPTVPLFTKQQNW